MEISTGLARVRIFDSNLDMASSAAEQAATFIAQAIEKFGRARVMAATGNSQIQFIEALVSRPEIDWQRVEIFHMDEYVGLSASHPSSFRFWIKTRLVDEVHPAAAHYLAADAPDLDAEIRRYSELLLAGPLHVAFVGFGENGHIAFNDPDVGSFHDPAIVKRVELDEACRRQQTGEGHFPDLNSVPKEALTVTCPGLFRASAWLCCVPDARKAEAVRNALEGPISTACPASLVRCHPNATVYLDSGSAALLSSVQSATS